MHTTDFSAKRQNKPQSPIDIGSSPAPKSLVSSSLDDVTPYMFIRMSRLQPENLLIDDAKRLLQQYGPSRHAVLKRLSVASGAKRTWLDLLLADPVANDPNVWCGRALQES
jgi:hypothetical protein